MTVLSEKRNHTSYINKFVLVINNLRCTCDARRRIILKTSEVTKETTTGAGTHIVVSLVFSEGKLL